MNGAGRVAAGAGRWPGVIDESSGVGGFRPHPLRNGNGRRNGRGRVGRARPPESECANRMHGGYGRIVEVEKKRDSGR